MLSPFFLLWKIWQAGSSQRKRYIDPKSCLCGRQQAYRYVRDAEILNARYYNTGFYQLLTISNQTARANTWPGVMRSDVKTL